MREAPSTLHEMTAALALIGFAAAGFCPTPAYAYLSGHTLLHPPVWAWMAWCAAVGILRLWNLTHGSLSARRLLSLFSLVTWAMIWLTLAWFRGEVGALYLIPPLFAGDVIAYLQSGKAGGRIRKAPDAAGDGKNE